MLAENPNQEKDYNENKLSMSSFESDYSSDESFELPQVFQVKYLGCQDARGLWGIKHTRKPVDKMVEAVKSSTSGISLPLLKIVISENEISFSSIGRKNHANIHKVYPIRDISYGVQDIVYTRIFSMIVVRDSESAEKSVTPFECHGFVCESKYQAKQLTYALAHAFKLQSDKVKPDQSPERTPPIKIHPHNIRVDIICKT